MVYAQETFIELARISAVPKMSSQDDGTIPHSQILNYSIFPELTVSTS
jgi:hypothetical protein